MIEFSTSELVVLETACRTADTIDELQRALKRDGVVVPGYAGQPRVNGVLGELRLQRQSLARLVAQLAVPEPGETVGLTPRQRRARTAAQKRWRDHPKRQRSKHA